MSRAVALALLLLAAPALGRADDAGAGNLVPADRGLLERALAESRVDVTPDPPDASYAREVYAAVVRAVLRFLGEKGSVLLPPRWALIAIAVVVLGAALLLVLLRLLPALRDHRRQTLPAAGSVAAGAPASSEAFRDAAAWRAELERLLAERRMTEALEAAWWWLARSLAGPRAEPTWTSRDLVRWARRDDLLELVRRLDAMAFGPSRPGVEELRTLVGRLEAALS